MSMGRRTATGAMHGAADKNANRLRPTRAVPGVAGDIPTVDIRVKLELRGKISRRKQADVMPHRLRKLDRLEGFTP